MTADVQLPAPAVPRAVGAGPAPVELTEREKVALTALATGLTVQAAARRLEISERTLRRFQARAAVKFGALGPVQAAVLAAAAGVLDLDVIRSRALPCWPGEVRACNPASAAISRNAAERRARFAELRAEGLTVAAAARVVGVAKTTATGYEQERKRAG